jgi:hypothetical protein
MPETSGKLWPDKLKKLGINIENLHLSILSDDTWKALFKRDNIKLIHEYSHPTAKFIILIYEKRSEL